mgnify:CR=1 FL=1|tara:strand:+ start:1096 stop:1290 length:195 start_codon:yes stop_codon:yes gene_type:complete
MEKCPKCGYTNESFNDMMNRVIKEVSDRHRKELGYGIPDKIEIKKEKTIRRKEWQPEKRQRKQK